LISVEKIDTNQKSQVSRFIHLPFRLYKDYPQWVPPILIEHQEQLDHNRHPFYEHSEADFFIAVSDGRDSGRIAVLENKPFNKHHRTQAAQFYFFESENDQEVANALFGRAFEWSHQRGLDTMVGPKGLGPLDGFGLLLDGFEHRQMMTMMNYNPPYYVQMIEKQGFTKEVDFISCYAKSEDYRLPDRIYRIAERVQQRGTLRVRHFRNKAELRTLARPIGEAYNKAFIDNWEYYPLSEREIDFVLKKLEMLADPQLIKLILNGQDIVGFLFAFPDIAPAIQRWRGRLLPFGVLDMLLEMRRTSWVAINTAGILPEFQGRGGNALLYTEIEKTVHKHQFKHYALYQVAETAVNMRRDLVQMGVKAYKNHRVYTRKL
jgi:hypothetical protein